MGHQGFKSPLHKMVATTETDLWNDSCSVSELSYAIENGRRRGDGESGDRPVKC